MKFIDPNENGGQIKVESYKKELLPYLNKVPLLNLCMKGKYITNGLIPIC